MSGPIDKHILTPYSMSNSTPVFAYRQKGSDNGVLKGRVSSDYYTNTCQTTSIPFGATSGIPAPVDCRTAHPYGCLGFVPNNPRLGPVRNQAYERFRSRATGPSSAIGTTIAEWRESCDLVTGLALEAREHWRNFRRGRWGKFVETRIDPGRTRGARNRAHGAALNASDAWLTWWFGISPILGDIHNATELMSSPLPKAKRYYGRSKLIINDRPGPNWTRNFRVDVTTGARVKLVNPNLYLANQLGLVNPASIAWEIIPFSFLVDWCFDVSSFFESFTDFIGSELSMPFTAYKVKGQWERSGLPNPRGRAAARQSEYLREKKLIRPTPNAQIQANLGTSLTRAASAVSLIMQHTR